MKVFKGFIKPFEALQRKVEINKIKVNFFSSSGTGTGRVKSILLSDIPIISS